MTRTAEGAGARGLTLRWLGRLPYGDALALQESLLGSVADGEHPEVLLTLEHEAVYTLGRGADESDLMGAPARLQVPVFRVGRGGGATFHGPGQLVAYPLIRLPHGRDVHRYVRQLERSLIDTCARYGVAAATRPEVTGVWAAGAKIASIGVGVRRGVTYHGIALNLTTDLRYFEQIVPCRESGLRYTTLARLLGHEVGVDEVAGVFADCFAATFGYAIAPREAA
jgi:lipoate-protein ligase B